MPPAWTVMIFMAGDNNLSSMAAADLAELRRVGSTADVRILVEVDRAGVEGTQRLAVERDGRGESVLDLGETDSGDAETVLGFVRWAVDEAPAERYALVLWNHGGGWSPAEIDRLAAEQGAPEWSAGEGVERSRSGLSRLLFRSALARILRRGPRERAICSDDGSGHSLDTLELGRLLAAVRGVLGRPLDLLGMDACSMSALEVACELRDEVRLLVASEDTEPAEGWPYEAILVGLVARPEATPAELAAAIVTRYDESYPVSRPGEVVTQSAIDLQRLDTLLVPLDALAQAVTGGMPARAQEVWSAQLRSARFCQDTQWDLLHFASLLQGLTADPAVAQAAAEVCVALHPGEGPVLATAHRGARVVRCGGVSAYLPALHDVSPYYPELAFARRHRWLELLRAYRRVLQPGPAVAPPAPGGTPTVEPRA